MIEWCIIYDNRALMNYLIFKNIYDFFIIYDFFLLNRHNLIIDEKVKHCLVYCIFSFHGSIH